MAKSKAKPKAKRNNNKKLLSALSVDAESAAGSLAKAMKGDAGALRDLVLSDANPRPVGRPTEYGPHVLEITKAYFESGYKERGQQIPTKAGLGIILGVSQQTLANWAEKSPEFVEALRMGLNYTELELLDGGLSGRFNPTFTGLVAANTIGYRSTKSEIDHKSSDGSMSQKPTVIKIIGV